jgi:hypothetical protein
VSRVQKPGRNDAIVGRESSVEPRKAQGIGVHGTI